jgi:hypothetical protein
MKSQKTLMLAGTLLLALTTVKQTSAADLFWDPNHNGSGAPGSGWLTASPWSATQPTGSVTTPVAWNSATPDNANFARNGGGSVGTVSLITQGSVTAGKLTVGAGGVGTSVIIETDDSSISGSLTIGTAGTTGLVQLNTGSGLTLQRAAGASAAVNFTLAGTAGGTSGPGTLTLNNAGNAGNLIVNLSTSSATPVILANTGGITTQSSTNASGLVGFVSTNSGPQAAQLKTSFDTSGLSASSRTTFLGATAGNSLLVNTGGSVTGAGGLQIGATSPAYTGTVRLNTANAINLTSSTVNVNLAGGTLTLAASNAISSTTNIKMSVTGSSTNLISLTGGITDTVGNLTLSANSIIDFGTDAGGNTLKFTGVSNLAGNTLQIWNYTPGVDHLFFGTSSDGSGLLGSALGPSPFGYGQTFNNYSVKFFSDNGVTPFYGGGAAEGGAFLPAQLAVNGQGEIVPVPEPTAVLSAALLLLAIGWKERRHFMRVRGARGQEAAMSELELCLVG